MNDFTTCRKTLRQQIRAQRRALSEREQQLASKQLCDSLISTEQVQSAKRIAIYLANDGELDPLDFIHWCWQQNKEVYLPVVHPFNDHHLLFLRYEPSTELIANKYDILEPKLDVTKVCPVEKLNILFTPLVAFDLTGARLGMGGGFYDRTLAHWYHQKTTHISYNTEPEIIPSVSNACSNDEHFIPIGIAHNCQLVAKVPTATWDIPLPEIITPNKSYFF